MKYLKMRKTDPDNWFEVNYLTAKHTLETCYKREVISELLNTPNTYPCLFSYIKVEKD